MSEKSNTLQENDDPMRIFRNKMLIYFLFFQFKGQILNIFSFRFLF